jgi:hypothetical protein
MSELTITVIRLGFLAVLWLFVLTAISVMRSDLFGSTRTATARPAPVPAPRPAKPVKLKANKRGAPSKLVVTRRRLRLQPACTAVPEQRGVDGRGSRLDERHLPGP